MAIDLDQVVSLIQRAGKAVGSEYKLAKALGVPDTTITAWKAGRRTCVPADRARIAGFAGEDPLQELARATLAVTKGTKRGEQLESLLGKLLHQTGAARLSALVAAAALSGSASFIRCIDRLNRRPLSPTARANT